MGDTLPVTLVIPATFQNDVDKISMLLGTAETAFKVNGWDVTFKTKIHMINQPDYSIYDKRFCSRTSLATPQNMLQRAKEIAGDPRYRYVIFVCDSIVDATDWHTDTVTVTGTNGESLTGLMVSILSLIGRKNTVGNADGQTWAHEMGHGLGLDHVNDENNFMTDARHRNAGGLTGFDISQQQLATMSQHCQALTQQGL